VIDAHTSLRRWILLSRYRKKRRILPVKSNVSFHQRPHEGIGGYAKGRLAASDLATQSNADMGGVSSPLGETESPGPDRAGRNSVGTADSDAEVNEFLTVHAHRRNEQR
jgi:hypothetical protein